MSVTQKTTNWPNTRLVTGGHVSASKGASGSSPTRQENTSEIPKVATLFTILTQISGEMQSLGEIRKAKSSMEEKLTTL